MRATATAARTLAALIAGAGVLLAATVLAPAVQAATVQPATTRCTPAQVLAWVGLSGRAGSARGVAVPLEFSNISRRTCTIAGFPAVLAVRLNGRAAGPLAGRRPGAGARTITLDPGQTAHAVLIVAVAASICRAPITASALLIQPPGVASAQGIGLEFSVCARHRTLSVGPVRAGTGIP
jgi:hypothetical protein